MLMDERTSKMRPSDKMRPSEKMTKSPMIEYLPIMIRSISD